MVVVIVVVVVVVIVVVFVVLVVVVVVVCRCCGEDYPVGVVVLRVVVALVRSRVRPTTAATIDKRQ